MGRNGTNEVLLGGMIYTITPYSIFHKYNICNLIT
jgi:hypothetical protein